jgi:hypothetical protein
MVQDITFCNAPRLAKNFQVNFNLLLKLQSLRQPVPAKERAMTAGE